MPNAKKVIKDSKGFVNGFAVEQYKAKLEESKQGEVGEAVTSFDVSIQDLASSISELKRRLEIVLIPAQESDIGNSATRAYQSGLASRLGDFNSYIRTNTEIINDLLNRLQL